MIPVNIIPVRKIEIYSQIRLQQTSDHFAYPMNSLKIQINIKIVFSFQQHTTKKNKI